MARLRFHLDENVDIAVAHSLRRRGLDVATSADRDLLSTDDATQLAHAAADGRVFVTHDSDFLHPRWKMTPHAGIAYCAMGTRSVGQLVRTLALMAEVLSAGEMANRLEFL